MLFKLIFLSLLLYSDSLIFNIFSKTIKKINNISFFYDKRLFNETVSEMDDYSKLVLLEYYLS
jgi:hypothetical protein